MNKSYLTRLSSLFSVLLVLLCATSSCTDDFERINKNPLLPDKDMEVLDNVIFGMYLPNLQKTVIPMGTYSEGTTYDNRYQVGVNMTGDAWAGYMSATENKFDGGYNFTNYFFSDGRLNYVYDFMITQVYAPWLQIRRLSQETEIKTDEIFAIAQIIKIAALHRSTDMFGPIPYSNVGSGDFEVEYDSQEAVYNSFFVELKDAIEALTVYSQTNDKTLEEFDAIYEGDVNKWIKFANSLMLRLAIRVRYVDANLAQEYAELALNHPKGIIETPADAPKINEGAGIRFRNPLKLIWDTYNDTRMGATMYSYLKGYNDPRINVYFRKSAYSKNTDYHAIRTGIPQVDYYKDYSVPNFEYETPLYWMTASEVLFLRAEGALQGWNMGGTPSSLYESGVKMSFEENGLSNAETYLLSESMPADYEDAKNSNMNISAPSKVTVKWSDSLSEEDKLEKIITQKYLAIFPNGIEAWTEWRRTGYPKQIVVYENMTNSDVETGDGVTGGVRRMPYPRTEYDNNLANLQKAISSYLGGSDKASVKVWWDKK